MWRRRLGMIGLLCGIAVAAQAQILRLLMRLRQDMGMALITQTTPGQPEQIQVRVQLRKSNANYGQLSQIATVTVNP